MSTSTAAALLLRSKATSVQSKIDNFLLMLALHAGGLRGADDRFQP